MLSLHDKIQYINYIGNVEIVEIATIVKVEENKVYCKDNYNNILIFSTIDGYCWNDNTTYNAKKIMIIK